MKKSINQKDRVKINTVAEQCVGLVMEHIKWKRSNQNKKMK